MPQTRVGPVDGDNHEMESENIRLSDLTVKRRDSVETQWIHSMACGILETQQFQNEQARSSSESLIKYFSQLRNEAVVVDLEYVQTLLDSGAEVNVANMHGEGILHEVAAVWHVDVANFLIDRGANVNIQDSFGLTPLHFAASADYPEMVDFLIGKGADKEARSKRERQTPLFFAAKCDACASLKALIKHGCNYKDTRDYKGRTPIHVAASLNCRLSVKFLLGNGSNIEPAPIAVFDYSGTPALSFMIYQMPHIAATALDHLQVERKSIFQRSTYLHALWEKINPIEPQENLQVVTPLHTIVSTRAFDLLVHPVVLLLIDQLWVRFARPRALIKLLLNLANLILWTVLGVLVEFRERHHYNFPEDGWRVFLSIVAICLAVWQAVDEEILDFRRIKKSEYNLKTWRIEEMEADLADQDLDHPRLKFNFLSLKHEIHVAKKRKAFSYFSDIMNLYDFCCFVMLLASIISHIVDIADHTEEAARVHIRLMSVTIILLWIRFMKSSGLRAFMLVGPMIVILGRVIKDMVQFLILYLFFYIPFVCAFYMMFGGDKYAYDDRSSPSREENVTVKGFNDFNNALFSMFRLTLVDDYDFDGMNSVDPVMTPILVGGWLALSAILCLNLFIAILSETLSKYRDHAYADALLQKATIILGFWDGMNKKSRDSFLHHMWCHCSPLTTFYDASDDRVDEPSHIVQIKEQINNIQEQLLKSEDEKKTRLGRKLNVTGLDESDDDDDGAHGSQRGSGASVVSKELFTSEVKSLREEVKSLKALLQQFMSNSTSRGDGVIATAPESLESGSVEERSSSRSRRKKKKRKEKPGEPESSLTETLGDVQGDGVTATAPESLESGSVDERSSSRSRRKKRKEKPGEPESSLTETLGDVQGDGVTATAPESLESGSVEERSSSRSRRKKRKEKPGEPESSLTETFGDVQASPTRFSQSDSSLGEPSHKTD